MRKRSPALDAVALVAQRLGPLADSVAFLGGTIVDLLLTDPAAPPTRATRDVDLIVEIATRRQYWALERELRARAFVQDEEDGIICRWVIAGIKVDVMPTEPEVLGFSTRWYLPAVRSAETHYVGEVAVRVVTAPYFVATKLDAFSDDERSHGDLWTSHDIQDVIALVDGRVELLAEVESAPEGPRQYIASTIAGLFADRDLENAVAGHLRPDAASQARVDLVIDRLRRLSVMAS